MRKENETVEKLPQNPLWLVERISKLLILRLSQAARTHSKDFFNSLESFSHTPPGTAQQSATGLRVLTSP